MYGDIIENQLNEIEQEIRNCLNNSLSLDGGEYLIDQTPTGINVYQKRTGIKKILGHKIVAEITSNYHQMNEYALGEEPVIQVWVYDEGLRKYFETIFSKSKIPVEIYS